MVNKLIVLMCLVAPSLVLNVHADFLEDIKKLSERDDLAVVQFDEQTPGFDLKDDKTYYQDNLIDELYKRSKFQNGLITLAGQGPDRLGMLVHESTYPFAVAQRSSKGSGVMADRWDVRDFRNGKVQLFALYHGEGKNNFVVNKVRAHLLRKLANAIQEHIPLLDRSLEDDAANYADVVNTIHDDFTQVVENVFAEVDQAIRGQMYDSDDSTATATVVIVTQKTIITAAVGDSRVLSYDDSSVIKPLTHHYNDLSSKNVFGAKKSRTSSIVKPHVAIYPREGIQFVVLESRLVAQLDDYYIFRTIISEVNHLKGIKENEQKIFSSSVSRILDSLCDSAAPFKRIFSRPLDFSIILIGLERDYKTIH